MRSRRGMSLIWMIVGMSALVGLASLGVDLGRVQIAKTQLRAAADAAARAGATMLGDFAKVQDAAASIAAANTCNGTPISIDKTIDVEFVKWDSSTRTYTVLTGTARNSANAVRVSCNRTGTSGIDLMFGGLIGMPRCNVTASAVAQINPAGYGLVGLDYIKLSGNSSASYWSSTNTVSGNAGNIASNGNITSSGNSNVKGTVWKQSNATVSGVTADEVRTLSNTLSYPNGSSGVYSKNNNDNWRITPSGLVSNTPDLTVGTGKTATLPPGNYWFRNVSIAATGSMVCTGKVNIYYYGTFSMYGGTSTYNSVPGNLMITAIPSPTGAAPGSLTIGGNASLYANIYAPQSAVILNGTGNLYGSIVGKSIDISGTADVYYDLNGATGDNSVKLVK